MESLLLRDRLTLAAVLGAGVVIGVSSLYVYFKYTRTLSRDLNRLTRTIESLDREIKELKSTRCAVNLAAGSSPANSSSAAAKSKQRRISTNNEDALSHVSSGEDLEEYFDVADESDINQSWASINGEVPLTSNASDEMQQFYEEIDNLFLGDSAQHQQAYDRLIAIKREHEGNVEILWRLARACLLISMMYEDDPERKKTLTFEGLKFATLALAIDDTIGQVHKWYAALLGRTTDYVGIQEKIQNGYTFKEHVDAAIRALPDDHSLYFMKGRWCYEVATLSWIERKVASTLFAAPPTSSYAEAIEQFFQVEKLYPNKWKENMLFIAKCCIAEKKYSQAVEWLDKAIDLECKNSEEKTIHSEVTQLLSKYKSYRIAT
ncbi:hypothetical protein CHUAL_008874 [Chamberlinius hualienensis]